MPKMLPKICINVKVATRNGTIDVLSKDLFDFVHTMIYNQNILNQKKKSHVDNCAEVTIDYLNINQLRQYP